MELLNSALNFVIEGLLFVFVIYGGLTALVLLFGSNAANATQVVGSEVPSAVVEGEQSDTVSISSLQEELDRTRAELSATKAALQEAQQQLVQYQNTRDVLALEEASQEQPVLLENPWEVDANSGEGKVVIAAEPSLPQIAKDTLKIWTRKGKKVVKEATIPIDVPETIQRFRFRNTAVIRLSDLEAIATLA